MQIDRTYTRRTRPNAARTRHARRAQNRDARMNRRTERRSARQRLYVQYIRCQTTTTTEFEIEYGG